MANRDLDFSPQVTSVTAEDPQDSALTAGAEVLDQIGQVSAKAKALNAASQTSLAFRQLDQQYRMSAASNPNDPQALADLQQSRADVITAQGQNVPSIAMREYQQQTIELGKASDVSNKLWSTKQMVRNASADIQVSYKNNLQQASLDGQQFANSGSPATEIEGALHYAQLNQMMSQFATPVIGAEKTAQYLKNFQQDYTKTFVAAVAENNPQMANALLEQDAIKQHFTPQDINDMSALVQRTTKQQALIKSGQITKNDSGLNELVNDQEKSYYEKRSAIDEMDMSGAISPKAASAARRVIKSSDDLDTQTDTPTMADLINQTYDLNANAKLEPGDYLIGVQNLHQQILEKQATGDLTARDAAKLTREVNNLTGSKEGEATTSVGNNFYSANQKFNALPPEFRGDATRQLFYASQGQNMTDQQLNAHAGAIIDKINKQRVDNMKATVAKVGDDSAFLKTLGYTDAQVQEAAKNKGISVQQVIQALRSKYRTNLVRAKPVSGHQQQEDDNAETPDTSNGIRLKEPAPPSIFDDQLNDGADEQ